MRKRQRDPERGTDDQLSVLCHAGTDETLAGLRRPPVLTPYTEQSTAIQACPPHIMSPFELTSEPRKRLCDSRRTAADNVEIPRCALFADFQRFKRDVTMSRAVGSDFDRAYRNLRDL